MATPAIYALRNRYPSANILAVCRPPVGDVFVGTRLIDEVMSFDPRRGSHWNFIRELRRRQIDTAILFPNSFRSGLYAWLSGARNRVGISRNGRGWMLTRPLPSGAKHIPSPVMDEYLRIVEPLGCDVSSKKMHLAVTPADIDSLNSAWKHCFAGRAEGYVCLNPGGAFGAAKHWPEESFADLAIRIANQYGKRVLVLCGPAERESARKIAATANHRLIASLADAPPGIGLTKAAIRNCDLLITTDSGPRHFASAFEVPVITLFGPTHIAWSENFDPAAVHLQLELDCGPCQQRVCPLMHHRCMRELTPQMVFKAVSRKLAEQQASSRVVA